MADREEDDLQMALRMSLHGSPPEPKRSKAVEVPDESPEARERRLQRELRAEAAEKRMRVLRSTSSTSGSASPPGGFASAKIPVEERKRGVGVEEEIGEELSPAVTEQLFVMLFGSDISRGILAQWSNQGIRFSSDADTCIGLVQHEGGPCGVLAAIQAFVLKYLIFFPDDLASTTIGISQQNSGHKRVFQSPLWSSFTDISENVKTRALVRSMVEILFSCGNKKRAAIATLSIFSDNLADGSEDGQKDEIISKALENLAIESASDLQKVLRVTIYNSEATAFHRVMADLPIFQSRMGAMLFLISAVLSRGLDVIQDDRDDPSLPLVTTPFGHASQEIVNMLLCGQAVPNVFDDKMDLGGDMFLKGVPANVDVGFLTLLESLNFCKVGHYLKCPTWPIWVVGSESHYTVLFALDTSVQDENELEQREARIRSTFNSKDQSGGGGFLTVDGFHEVLRETNINLPQEKLDSLCGTGYIVWSDFWQVLLVLDGSMGGLKDSTGLGKKQFDLYHFNGIAKSVLNGNPSSENETPVQRPRLCKLTVTVPPRWTQEEFMAEVSSSGGEAGAKDGDSAESSRLPEPAQHAPLVDCIRTRWPRAVCNWVGDPPSIV